MPTYAITMLTARIGIPVPAAMNAVLGRYLEAPMLARTILLAGEFLTALVVAVITRRGAIVKLVSALRHLLLAGILVAFYVLSITVTAPNIGADHVIFVRIGNCYLPPQLTILVCLAHSQ